MYYIATILKKKVQTSSGRISRVQVVYLYYKREREPLAEHKGIPIGILFTSAHTYTHTLFERSFFFYRCFGSSGAPYNVCGTTYLHTTMVVGCCCYYVGLFLSGGLHSPRLIAAASGPYGVWPRTCIKTLAKVFEISLNLIAMFVFSKLLRC